MKIKYFNGVFSEINIGTIIDGVNSGNPSYYDIPEIKEIEVDGQWVPNPGYDLAKVKSQKISQIENQIIDMSIKLDKATSLNLSVKTELQTKLTELMTKKDEINALK